MYRLIPVFIIILLCAISAGCAAPVTQTVAIAPEDGEYTQYYWWYVRYRIVWPEDTAPDWRVDLLLADAVVKPVLNEYRQKFRYWRFHRRAVRDVSGHQFSFLFFADTETAKKVYATLLADSLTKKLIETNVLQKIVTDNLAGNKLVNVADTSDKNWSETLQNAWPAYMMGVSDMWLQLIEKHVDTHAPETELDTLLLTYGNANDKITAMWQEEGRHAFLHHLNAIFGYAPIIINEAVKF